MLGLWQAVVSFTSVSPYVAKGPVDVWNFLFVTEPGAHSTAAEHRQQMWDLTQRALQDAAIGFVVGMTLAIVLAMLFTLSKTVEAGVMPLALLLRSVPLVSIAPVIILRDRTWHPGLGRRDRQHRGALPGVGVRALRPQPGEQGERRPRPCVRRRQLRRAAQGRRSRRAASMFAAARVSVPGAVTGALLAEWLSTGKGIGGMIQKFNASAQFDALWASVAIITVITLLLYNLVQPPRTSCWPGWR